MKISLEKLAKAVQEKRKVLGLTQDELGRITEINRLLIGRIESQKFLPSIPQLENLLKKYIKKYNLLNFVVYLHIK